MKKGLKYKPIPNEIRLLVVASSAIISAGVANGRNIPVVFVPSDSDHRIDDIISFHKNIQEGSCSTILGLTSDKKYAILTLDFQDPIKQRVILFFDIIKFGFVVEQIMYSQCLFLTVGDEKSNLALSIDQSRILVDVFCDDFKEVWANTFKEEFTKYLRRKYKLSKQQSFESFDKMLAEWDVVKKFRLN